MYFSVLSWWKYLPTSPNPDTDIVRWMGERLQWNSKSLFQQGKFCLQTCVRMFAKKIKCFSGTASTEYNFWLGFNLRRRTILENCSHSIKTKSHHPHKDRTLEGLRCVQPVLTCNSLCPVLGEKKILISVNSGQFCFTYFGCDVLSESQSLQQTGCSARLSESI